MYLAARNYPLTNTCSISEMFPRMKQAGYRGVEFCLTDKYQHLRPDTIEPFYRTHVRQMAEENGLKISMVSCHPDHTYDPEVFAFEKKAIPLIREFGTDLFLVGTNYPYFYLDELRRDNANWRREYLAHMRELSHIAEDSGVRLVVEPEPHSGLRCVDDYFMLCEEIDAPQLGYNFDVGHAFMTEPDLTQAIRRLEGHIVHTHIENIRRGEHLHRLPEDGEIDLQKVFQELKSVGYDGALCVELHAFDQLSEACVEPLKRMLRNLEG